MAGLLLFRRQIAAVGQAIHAFLDFLQRNGHFVYVLLQRSAINVVPGEIGNHLVEIGQNFSDGSAIPGIFQQDFDFRFMVINHFVHLIAQILAERTTISLILRREHLLEVIPENAKLNRKARLGATL